MYSSNIGVVISRNYFKDTVYYNILAREHLVDGCSNDYPMTLMAVASIVRIERPEDSEDAVEMEEEMDPPPVRGSENLRLKCVIFFSVVPTGVMEMRVILRWWDQDDDPPVATFCIVAPHCCKAVRTVSSSITSCSGFPKKSAVDLECVKRKNAALTCTTLYGAFDKAIILERERR